MVQRYDECAWKLCIVDGAVTPKGKGVSTMYYLCMLSYFMNAPSSTTTSPTYIITNDKDNDRV